MGKAIQPARPTRMVAKTSPLVAMQWAKLPRPTTRASIQMIMTEPVMECEAGDQPGDRGDDPAAHDGGPEDGGGRDDAMASAPSWPSDWTTAGRDGMGARCEGGEGEGAECVEGKDDGPEAHGLPEVAFFREHQCDRVQGVFGEELRAAEDDDDEAERVEHFADEERGRGGRGSGGGEDCDGDGVAERGETHEDAAGEAGDGERDAGAA